MRCYHRNKIPLSKSLDNFYSGYIDENYICQACSELLNKNYKSQYYKPEYFRAYWLANRDRLIQNMKKYRARLKRKVS